VIDPAARERQFAHSVSFFEAEQVHEFKRSTVSPFAKLEISP
jgi:hypothetical protein